MGNDQKGKQETVLIRHILPGRFRSLGYRLWIHLKFNKTLILKEDFFYGASDERILESEIQTDK